MDQPWNANIHYDALLDAMVPLGTQCVLDVGCGDGLLAARLARRIPYVTAVDIDAPVLRRAQTRFANAPIRWLHADIMTAELPNAGFDAVVSNAALHHIEEHSDGAEPARRAGNSRWDAGRGHLRYALAAKRLMALDKLGCLRHGQSRQGQVGTFRSDQVAAPADVA